MFDHYPKKEVSPLYRPYRQFLWIIVSVFVSVSCLTFEASADEKRMMTYSMAMGSSNNHPGEYLLTLKFDKKVLAEDVRIYLLHSDKTDLAPDELVLDDYLVIGMSTENQLTLAFNKEFFRKQVLADSSLEMIARFSQDIFDYVKGKFSFRNLEKSLTLKPVKPEGRAVKRRQ